MAAILPDFVVAEAAATAERFRAVVEGRHWNDAGFPDLHVTVSVGISEYPVLGTNAESLVATADTALYAAKEGGRNRVELARPPLTGLDALPEAPASQTGGGQRHVPDTVSMDVSTQRTVELLRSIPQGDVKVCLHIRKQNPVHPLTASQQHRPLPLPDIEIVDEVSEIDVSPERNVFTCKRDGGRTTLWVPLDDVQSVWSTRPDSWAIRVAGRLVSTNNQFNSLIYESLHRL